MPNKWLSQTEVHYASITANIDIYQGAYCQSKIQCGLSDRDLTLLYMVSTFRCNDNNKRQQDIRQRLGLDIRAYHWITHKLQKKGL
jgi:hypothetical protein